MNDLTLINKKEISKIELIDKKQSSKYRYYKEEPITFLGIKIGKMNEGWYIRLYSGSWTFCTNNDEEVLSGFTNKYKYVIEDNVLYEKPYMKIFTSDGSCTYLYFKLLEEAKEVLKSLLEDGTWTYVSEEKIKDDNLID